MVRTDGQSLGTGGSSLTAWGVELGFGRAQERKEKEGEETDARDPVVSEGKGREGTRAGVLTRVQAGRGKRRKRKGWKGKFPRKVSFLFFF